MEKVVIDQQDMEELLFIGERCFDHDGCWYLIGTDVSRSSVKCNVKISGVPVQISILPHSLNCQMSILESPDALGVSTGETFFSDNLMGTAYVECKEELLAIARQALIDKLIGQEFKEQEEED